MNILQILKLTNGILSQNNIDHALIGGLALGVYGYERFTNDVDLLVDGKKHAETEKALISVGFELYRKSDDLMQFMGIGRLDLIFAHRPISLQMLADAKFIDGLGIRCLMAEDIIGLKIQAYCDDKSRRLKDLADIQELVRTNSLDKKRVKKYADFFNEWPTIEEFFK